MGRKRFRGQHVLITGGSTGIGFAVAQEFVRLGANVTLVARTAAKLQAAVEQLQALQQGTQSAGKVRFELADTSQPVQINAAVAAAEKELGPVDMLIANAGTAVPGHFHNQSFEVFEQAMRTNYLGCVATLKAVYPGMVARKTGQMCIVSSAMALMGFSGYASYAPTKCALKGLADVLRNELQGTGVRISIVYPPDVDTPGFQHENTIKPKDCKAISEHLGVVFPAEKVAKGIVAGLASGQYILSGPDLGLNLHAESMLGLAPRSFLSTIKLMLVGWLLTLIQALSGWSMDRIAKKTAPNRFANLYQETAGSH